MTVHDPDVCSCRECTGLRLVPCWARPIKSYALEMIDSEEEVPTVRSKTRSIEVSLIKGKAELPAYLSLFHRHFEKACPRVVSANRATVVAPLDQLDMLLMDSPGHLANAIDSIEITYQKG